MPYLFPHILLLLLAVVVTLTSAVPSADPTKPSPGTCTISAIAVDAPDVSTGGSGCWPGTVGVAFSSDNSLLTLIFDDFQAAVGPKAGSVKKRTFCRVNVTMSSPGWAFDVSSVDFRSFVDIQKGVGVSLVSRWKWIDAGGMDMKGKVSLVGRSQFSESIFMQLCFWQQFETIYRIIHFVVLTFTGLLTR